MSKKENSSCVQSESDADSCSWKNADRGQTLPRLVVGGFVLAIVAVPLLSAMTDFQDGLASTPVFSPLSATVIALLLLAALVAGILGLD